VKRLGDGVMATFLEPGEAVDAALDAQAAKAGEVVVSEALLGRISTDDLRTGRRKRLRADGAPRELHLVRVSRD
jgi:class 3 adenylate cyclase